MQTLCCHQKKVSHVAEGKKRGTNLLGSLLYFDNWTHSARSQIQAQSQDAHSGILYEQQTMSLSL